MATGAQMLAFNEFSTGETPEIAPILYLSVIETDGSVAAAQETAVEPEGQAGPIEAGNMASDLEGEEYASEMDAPYLEVTVKVAEGAGTCAARTTLHIVSQEIDWESFSETGPGVDFEARAQQRLRKIGGDGAVPGAPAETIWKDVKRKDHHLDVDRLTTDSTCMQTFKDIQEGFFETEEEQDAEWDGYVLGSDEDESTFYYLLKNRRQVFQWYRQYQETGECDEWVNLERLVNFENDTDISNCIRIAEWDLDTVESMAWVYAPFQQAKAEGRLNDPAMPVEAKLEQHRTIIEETAERIDAFVHGRGDRLSLDTDFELLGRHGSFVIAEIVGKDAKIGLLRYIAALKKDPSWDGQHIRYMLYARNNSGKDRRTFTFGKTDVTDPIDFVDMAQDLNHRRQDIEKNQHTIVDHGTFGGSDLVFGSPRDGTKLPKCDVDSAMERAELNAGHPKPWMAQEADPTS